MKKLIITGFEPFGKSKTNPSWDAVSLLPDQLGELKLQKELLPVEYDRVGILMEEYMKRDHPDAVLCVGQAEGQAVMTTEYVAINLKDAAVPDNAGVVCDGEAILSEGPAAYFATFPVKRLAAAIQEAGVPAAVSYSAGTYVCNCLMYQMLALEAGNYPGVPGGFIHIPCDCSQVLGRSPRIPSLPLETMAKGLEAAVLEIDRYLRNGGGDLKQACGYTNGEMI